MKPKVKITWFFIFEISLYSCLSTFVLFTGILTLSAISKVRRQKDISSLILVANLVVVDICLNVSCLLNQIDHLLGCISLKEQPYPECVAQMCIFNALLMGSVLFTFLNSLDRYISIKMPMRYRSMMSAHRVKRIVAFVWAFIILFGLIPTSFSPRYNKCEQIWHSIVVRHGSLTIMNIAFFLNVILTTSMVISMFRVISKSQRLRLNSNRYPSHRSSSWKTLSSLFNKSNISINNTNKSISDTDTVGIEKQSDSETSTVLSSEFSLFSKNANELDKENNNSYGRIHTMEVSLKQREMQINKVQELPTKNDFTNSEMPPKACNAFVSSQAAEEKTRTNNEPQTISDITHCTSESGSSVHKSVSIFEESCHREVNVDNKSRRSPSHQLETGDSQFCQQSLSPKQCQELVLRPNLSDPPRELNTNTTIQMAYSSSSERLESKETSITVTDSQVSESDHSTTTTSSCSQILVTNILTSCHVSKNVSSISPSSTSDQITIQEGDRSSRYSKSHVTDHIKRRENKSPGYRGRHIRTAKLLFISMCVYSTLWLPCNVLLTISTYITFDNYTYFGLFKALGLTNSIMNFFVYPRRCSSLRTLLNDVWSKTFISRMFSDKHKR